ncbi:MAG: PaaI family thioesterase [Candidatus Hodarchaeales archaeon]|jgi:uncharacterized protein (TIGR00369 family)
MNIDENRMNQLLDLFNNRAPIAKTFGMKLSFNESADKNLVQARIDLPYNKNLDHALGGIHGGVYCTMLDNAAWFTGAINSPLSTWVATSDLNIRLLEAVSGKDLYSIGKIIKAGKIQIIAGSDLYNENGKLVGTGTGSFIVLKEDTRI